MELSDVGITSVKAGEFGEMTKTDTLRIMAASHVILAVVLIGISCYDGADSRCIAVTRGTMVCGSRGAT